MVSWALFFFDSVAIFFLETSSASSGYLETLNSRWLDSTWLWFSLMVEALSVDFITLALFSLFSAYFKCSFRVESAFSCISSRLEDLEMGLGSTTSSGTVSWGAFSP